MLYTLCTVRSLFGYRMPKFVYHSAQKRNPIFTQPLVVSHDLWSNVVSKVRGSFCLDLPTSMVPMRLGSVSKNSPALPISTSLSAEETQNRVRNGRLNVREGHSISKISPAAFPCPDPLSASFNHPRLKKPDPEHFISFGYSLL